MSLGLLMPRSSVKPPASATRPGCLNASPGDLQALAEGDLSERARRRAAELAQDADLRLSPPRPAPAILVPAADTRPARLSGKRPDRLPPASTLLTRPYKGTTVQVRVLEHGFVYEGECAM
jgi:hypothetical protein